MLRQARFHSHVSPSHHRPKRHSRFHHAAQTGAPKLRARRPVAPMRRALHAPVRPPRFALLALPDTLSRQRSKPALPHCFGFPIPAIRCAAPPHQNQPKWRVQHRCGYFPLAFVRPIIFRDVGHFAPMYCRALVCAPDIPPQRDWPHHKRLRWRLKPPSRLPIGPPLRLPPLVHRQKSRREFPLLPRPTASVALRHRPGFAFRV